MFSFKALQRQYCVIVDYSTDWQHALSCSKDTPHDR